MSSAFLPLSAVVRYAVLKDIKASSTDGGTFTSGAWQTRTLNTIEADTTAIVASLSSNRFTLIAGTYAIRAVAQALQVNNNQTRLQNITAGTTLLLGHSAHARASAIAGSDTALAGQITVAAGQALELQHQCTTTAATFGFGTGVTWGSAVFASVEIWKIG